MSLLITLYLSFFQVGLFAFGGGLAALPLIRDQVVVIHPWLDMATFTDLVTIAEMTPGPIALNAATFVGTRVAGLPGAIIATLGCITPSLIIVLILARVYRAWKDKAAFQGVLGGLRPAAVALIASAGLSIALLALFGHSTRMSLSAIDWIAVACFILALFVLRKWKPSPILVMLGAGVLGTAAKLLLP
ncbi:MAG: chromate transporter [Clostridiales bacterium]|jgi:chromate transporter|nr:chromate transporter [Clostridiales bacterium]